MRELLAAAGRYNTECVLCFINVTLGVTEL